MKRDNAQFSVPLEIYEVFRTMRREYDARARALGFTQGQWRVLSQLGRNEGISQVGLAEILDMQPISVARVLDRMEASGLIERRPDPQDRRALKLFLAPAAIPMLELLRSVGEELRAVATADLSETEQETLLMLLGRIRRSIDASNHPSQAEHAQRHRAGVGAGAARPT